MKEYAGSHRNNKHPRGNASLDNFGVCDNRDERTKQEKEMKLATSSPRTTSDATQLKGAMEASGNNGVTGNSALPEGLKSGIESLSGLSMDHVEVHYNSEKPARLNALAYARGSNIYLGPGQAKHLPHEAWHVVQQAQGRVSPTLHMKGVSVNDNEALESEADEMGEKALRIQPHREKKMTTSAGDTPSPVDISNNVSSPVQRIPYKNASVGRWYRVRTGSGVKILYLRSKRERPEVIFDFYTSERGRDSIVVKDENDILSEGVRDANELLSSGMHEDSMDVGSPDKHIEDDRSVSEESELSSRELLEEPTAGTRLGLVSWNVAHFSARDMDEALNEFERQFNSFSKEDWKTLFTNIDLFTNAFNEKIKEYKTSKGKFLSDSELRNKGFKRLTGDIPLLLSRLSEAVDELSNIRQEYNEDEIIEEINLILKINWREAWEAAQKDTNKRLELATAVKELRQFQHLAEEATNVIKAIRRIVSNSSVQTLLNRMLEDEYGALVDSLVSVPNANSILELARAMHTHNIALHLNEMFDNNSWLDIVLLQEINDPTLLGPDKSKDSLSEDEDDEPDNPFDAYYGPKLISGGDNPQQEYYPLLIRKNSGLTVNEIYQVTTSGEMKKAGDEIQWDKSKKKKNEKIFRPIIVYEVQRIGMEKPFWIGIVHTTPESDTSGQVAEWNRQNIYDEIRRGLATLQEEADKKGIPLIIGGDYYLTAEAVVRKGVATHDPEIALIKDKIRQLRDTLTQEVLLLNEDQREILRERIKFLDEAMRDDQLCRNIESLTVKRQVEKLELLIAQTVSGTNPKHDPLTRQIDVQIADFFIHNYEWQSVETGILRPEGRFVSLDTSELTYSRYWQRFSDHFPVAAIFSLDAEDLKQHEALVTTSGTQEAADEINMLRFAGYALKEEFTAWLEGLIGRHCTPASPLWYQMGIKLGAFVLNTNGAQPAYDNAIPDNFGDCLRKAAYLTERAAEVLASVKLKTLTATQILQRAMAWLDKTYTGLVAKAGSSPEELEDIPVTLRQYIQKIIELETDLEVEDDERLLITTPEDFEPAYSVNTLVKKLASYLKKPGRSSNSFTFLRSSPEAPRTVQINNHTWTVNKTTGDGNCFYNAIYETLNNVRANEQNQQSIRDHVVNAMLTNPQVQTHLFGAVPDMQALNAVVNQIIEPGNWTEDFTPSFVAEALNLEITVLDRNGNVYYIAGPTQANGATQTIYLRYNGVHFDSITQMPLA